MDRDTCEGCRYSDLDELGYGSCRRRAPVANGTSAGWASVYNTDWCGEYAMDTDKIQKAAELERVAELKQSLGDRRDWDGLDRLEAQEKP